MSDESSRAIQRILSGVINNGALVIRTLGSLASLNTVQTLNNAGAITYSGALLNGALILRDPNGAARTDVLPTAAQIVAAIGSAVGATASFAIRNTADAAETITVSGGTGVTLSGTMTIAQNNTRLFISQVTNGTSGAEAVTIYSVVSGTH